MISFISIAINIRAVNTAIKLGFIDRSPQIFRKYNVFSGADSELHDRK